MFNVQHLLDTAKFVFEPLIIPVGAPEEDGDASHITDVDAAGPLSGAPDGPDDVAGSEEGARPPSGNGSGTLRSPRRKATPPEQAATNKTPQRPQKGGSASASKRLSASASRSTRDPKRDLKREKEGTPVRGQRRIGETPTRDGTPVSAKVTASAKSKRVVLLTEGLRSVPAQLLPCICVTHLFCHFP
jgi:hypothetical protein